MGILRADRVSGLGGANAINGSVFFGGPEQVSGGVTSNNILITEVSSDFTFGTGDFTIEGWFYTPDLSNWNLLVGDNVYQSTGGWSLYLNTDPDVDWWKGAASVVSGATPTEGTWHHIAFSRASGTNRVFLDGALGASASDSTDYTGTQILIGANQLTTAGVSQWGFKGYVSNLRVIKGEAIYTAAFTAPTSRLEKTDNTVLLCCQSPGNVLQEATGKTLYTVNTPVASHFAPDVGEDYGTTFADNTKFDTLSYMVPPGGTTAESNRGRGILFGGGSPGRTSRIDYIEIPNGGNSRDFGDLVCGSVWGSGAGASSTRGVFWGGENQYTKLDYVTIATTGNATSFGTSSTNSNGGTCMSSETRAVYVLGAAANTMEYVTIATTGNTTDFGDQGIDDNLTNAAGLASPTRGIVSGGYGPSPYPQSNTIEYITIASTGNATDFGDATNTVSQGYGSSTHIRGVFAGGNGGSDVNTIDYITIASTGDAIDFGDTHSPTRSGSGTSDSHGGIS